LSPLRRAWNCGRGRPTSRAMRRSPRRRATTSPVSAKAAAVPRRQSLRSARARVPRDPRHRLPTVRVRTRARLTPPPSASENSSLQPSRHPPQGVCLSLLAYFLDRNIDSDTQRDGRNVGLALHRVAAKSMDPSEKGCRKECTCSTNSRLRFSRDRRGPVVQDAGGVADLWDRLRRRLSPDLSGSRMRRSAASGSGECRRSPSVFAPTREMYILTREVTK
jgi:hypothetical protein